MDSEALVNSILRKVRQQRKAERLELARQLNANSDAVERFEQFSGPVQLPELTNQQLYRFINKKLSESDNEDLMRVGGHLQAFKNWNMEQCCVCLELMGRQQNNLECGHWIHWECVRKSGRRRCPICRTVCNPPAAYSNDHFQLTELRDLLEARGFNV